MLLHEGSRRFCCSGIKCSCAMQAVQRRAALDGEAIAAASKASFDGALAAEAALRQRVPPRQSRACLSVPAFTNVRPRLSFYQVYQDKRRYRENC